MSTATRTYQPRKHRYQSRKHSKTFTGCWTCRARKVKCDEFRPECRQCSQKGYSCEGYDVRLQWMAPDTGDGAADAGPFASPTAPICRRSNVALERSLPLLPFHEIDEIMFHLDSLRPGKANTRGDETGGSRFLQCFGVFDSTSSNVDRLSAQTEPPSQQNHAAAGSTASSVDSSDADTLQTAALPDFFQSYSSNEALPFSLSTTSHHDHTFDGGDDLFADLPLSLDTYEDVLPLHGSDVSLNSGGNAPREQEPPGSDTWQEISAEMIPRSPSPQGLSSQERFLMHHYTNKVVNLFAVNDNPKSPWKTIHLPRALQSAGELVIHGSTSETRNALRNTLLSISAYCLSNEYRSQSRRDDAQKWTRAATCFRGRAIRHLKEAVGSGFSAEARPKYKECLATMLSMVSINVMSGDTETCGMHLDAAHRLITQAQGWKMRYSSKALALHRVYFFLRTVYQSTLIKTREKNDSTAAAWGSPSSTLSSIVPSDEAPPTSSSLPFNSADDMCTYAHIYGVPYSLLVLLNKAVDLVNQVVEERERTGTRTIPDHLKLQCEELEASIMEWEAEPSSMQYGSKSSKASTNLTIIEHTTRAFHNAIIIYFAQHVRLLGHHYMQPFITKVIQSIEEVERLKAETHIYAAPMYWPAFIAASEAFDQTLQERFRRWYSQVEFYGIESVRTGIRVLSDVWDQGPCPGATLTSIWRLVVQRTGVELLLS